MRKTSYGITAAAVILTTVFAILSLTRVDWVVAKYQSDTIVNARYDAKYGLSKVCERLVIDFPGGGSPTRKDFECRKFPDKENCDDENRFFCAAWTSAGYAVELAIGFGALTLATIVVGVTTHSRRRRIWRAVAGLVVFHAILQLVAFVLVVDQYRTGRFPTTFLEVKLGPALVFNAVAWVFGVLTAISVILTGMAADRGKRWAAGNRAYQPIEG